MRITRPPEIDVDEENIENIRWQANKEAYKCPYCDGEGIYTAVNGCGGDIEHIDTCSYRNCYDLDYKHTIIYLKIAVDKFRCRRCKAEWTGNPFYVSDELYEELKDKINLQR